MGMFDYIRCEVPLPDGFEGEPLFQTKDFDRALATHVIKDGGLYLDEGHYETVPKSGRPNLDAEEGPLAALKGSLRWMPNLVHQPDVHGVVNFYGQDANGKRHEYDAEFTDGRLVCVKVGGKA